jgi:uncharacterized metal-binding protein
MSMKNRPACAKCGVVKCFYSNAEADYPGFCPHENLKDTMKTSIEEGWKNPENRRINEAYEAVLKKGDYPSGNYAWCRIKEIIEFCNQLGYKKLGLGFCVGLKDEARVLTDILEKNGFEVVSVGCMAGAPTLGDVGLEEYRGASTKACNPIMQAEVLNKEKTELNIMLGLCVGHDILFIKYSRAGVTPLVVKDMALAHNPVAALYTSQSYYKKQLYP